MAHVIAMGGLAGEGDLDGAVVALLALIGDGEHADSASLEAVQAPADMGTMHLRNHKRRRVDAESPAMGGAGGQTTGGASTTDAVPSDFFMRCAVDEAMFAQMYFLGMDATATFTLHRIITGHGPVHTSLLGHRKWSSYLTNPSEDAHCSQLTTHLPPAPGRQIFARMPFADLADVAASVGVDPIAAAGGEHDHDANGHNTVCENCDKKGTARHGALHACRTCNLVYHTACMSTQPWSMPWPGVLGMCPACMAEVEKAICSKEGGRAALLARELAVYPVGDDVDVPAEHAWDLFTVWTGMDPERRARRLVTVREQLTEALAALPFAVRRRIRAAHATGEGAHPYIVLGPRGARVVPPELRPDEDDASEGVGGAGDV